MRKCATDPDHGASVRDTRLCEACYWTALDSAREGMAHRALSRQPPRIAPARQREPVEAREARAVAILTAHGRGMQRPALARALDVSDRTVTRLLADARAGGTIHLAADGWRAGNASDVTGEDAVTVAALVRDRSVATRKEIDRATGIGHSRMLAAVSRACAEGWLDMRKGRGFIPGPVEPPAAQ
jgi:transposase